MKFHLAKDNGLFKPADKDSEEKAKKVDQGEVVRAKSVNQRNYKFLQKYWKLVDITLHNLPQKTNKILQQRHEFQIKTKDDLHFYIKLKGGYIDKKFVGKDGNIGWEPQSIAFDSMDQQEFDQYFSDALDICADLLTIESDELINEVMQFMG